MISALIADFHAMVRVLASVGWPALWLIPFRALFYGLYAAGWWLLLRSSEASANLKPFYLFWATVVRDAVDRLLPVASVGGSVIGIRLVGWRGVPISVVGVSVIMEIALTVLASYGFTALGLMVLLEHVQGQEVHRFLFSFLLSVPVPLVLFLVLRYGSIFTRLHGLLRRLIGATFAAGAAAFDNELRAALGRHGVLCGVGVLQCVCIDVELIRSVVRPAPVRQTGERCHGRGARESDPGGSPHCLHDPSGNRRARGRVGPVRACLRVDGDVALALSVLKRARELAWGVPALFSWQWAEGRRLPWRTHAHE